MCIYVYIFIWATTKQACRNELVQFICVFPPTLYTSLYSYVLSTVSRKSNFTLYIYLAIFLNSLVSTERKIWARRLMTIDVIPQTMDHAT